MQVSARKPWPRLCSATMRSKAEVLAEIHTLIDGQLEILKDPMTPEQAVEYICRKEKIDRLLEEVSRNGSNGK